VSKADNSSDGRFSGTNKGCAVAQITPEAKDGGPLAVVKEGDLIEINIPNEKLNILISFEALQKRLDAWEAPQMRTEKGYLSIYSKMPTPLIRVRPQIMSNRSRDQWF